MAITIQVPWITPSYLHGSEWNQLLVWCLETYSLPGDRYTFHPGTDFMEFVFNNEQDALLFQLKTSGSRIENARS